MSGRGLWCHHGAKRPWPDLGDLDEVIISEQKKPPRELLCDQRKDLPHGPSRSAVGIVRRTRAHKRPSVSGTGMRLRQARSSGRWLRLRISVFLWTRILSVDVCFYLEDPRLSARNFCGCWDLCEQYLLCRDQMFGEEQGGRDWPELLPLRNRVFFFSACVRVENVCADMFIGMHVTHTSSFYVPRRSWSC